jgi:integrase
MLDSINVTTQAGLRDRALISLMVYSFARVGAALAMKVEDVYVQNRRLWVRLHEKGGKISTRASPDIRCTGITSIHATKRHGEAVA